jgi:hypothetical protein
MNAMSVIFISIVAVIVGGIIYTARGHVTDTRPGGNGEDEY